MALETRLGRQAGIGMSVVDSMLPWPSNTVETQDAWQALLAGPGVNSNAAGTATASGLISPLSIRPVQVIPAG